MNKKLDGMDEVRIYDKVLELVPDDFYDDDDTPELTLEKVLEGHIVLPQKYIPYVEQAKKILGYEQHH